MGGSDADGDLPLSGFDMTQEETANLNREGHRLFGLSWAGLPQGQDNPRFEETRCIHRLLHLRDTKYLGMSPRSEPPPHDNSYFSLIGFHQVDPRVQRLAALLCAPDEGSGPPLPQHSPVHSVKMQSEFPPVTCQDTGPTPSWMLDPV